MRRIGWTGILLSAGLVAVSAAIVAPSASHADHPIPIHLIETDSGFGLRSVSADGRYLFLGDALLDTLTSTSHEIGDDLGPSVFVDDDGSVYGVAGGELVRGGIGQPKTTVPITLPPGWIATGALAVDAERGRVAIAATNGNLARGRAFLVEIDTGGAITDTDQGLVSGTGNSAATWFLDDGTIVVAQFDLVGQTGFSSYAVWSSDLTSVSTIDPPPEHDMGAGPFLVDHGLEYLWFASDAGGIVDGVDAGPARMYRRHIGTGDTRAAPDEVLTAARIDAMPDGGLLLTIDLPPGGLWNRQLFRWDGTSNDIEQLTVGYDGSEPSGAVVDVFPPRGSDVITLTSRAANLASAIPHTARGTYLYQITTEDRPAPPPPPPIPEPVVIPPTEPIAATESARPVEADETYCVPAVGARPGDFVGANITPVNALRNGNGALHSSEDDPPSTANVNFRAGSVDPNVAFAQVGLDRTICFTNSHHGPVDVVIDALVVADGESFRSPSEEGAVRIADTRAGLGGSTLAADDTRCVDATGAAAGEFVGINITPVNATTRGNGALHSSDDEAPGTANVNFGPGSVDPNLAFAEVGSDGRVCFTNSVHGPIDVVMDLLFVAVPDAFGPPTADGAVRIVDTRSGVGAERFARDETQCFEAVGAAHGEWVGLNLTPVGATTNGNGAAHSGDDDPPATANVNFRAGSVDPNLALSSVGSGGDVCFSNSVHGPVDLVGDELFVAGADVFRSPTISGAYRLTDTREARHAEAPEPTPTDSPPTLTHIGEAADLRLNDASGDGRYVVLGDPLFGTGTVVDTLTSASFDLDHVPNHLSKVDDDGTVYTTDAGDLTVDSIDRVSVSISSSLPSPWFFLEVLDIDEARGRLLVRAGRDAGFTFGLFLVDIETGSSLTGGDPLPASADSNSSGWFQADGRFITLSGLEFRTWDAAGTASIVVEAPSGAESGAIRAIDPTATYIWFVSAAGGFVDGVEAGARRLYRRTIATGATIAAPPNAAAASTIEALPGGGVLVTTNDPLNADDPVGLNLWDGEEPGLRRLDVRIDGSDSNGRPLAIHRPLEGSMVTFTTFSTDLGTELIRPGRYVHAYQVDVAG